MKALFINQLHVIFGSKSVTKDKASFKQDEIHKWFLNAIMQQDKWQKLSKTQKLPEGQRKELSVQLLLLWENAISHGHGPKCKSGSEKFGKERIDCL